MRCIYDGVHPCGTCPACLANRQRGFMFRLDQEKENASFYFWLTLQYDNEHVPRLKSQEMCFSKEHCHKFFEKLRSRYKSENITFKHFLVSEYGPNSTKRPHYHCLLLAYGGARDLAERYKIRNEIREFLINKAWPYGHVTEKSYHGRVLSYLTKYCTKPELLGDHHTMKPFTLISRGIGLSFFENIPKAQKLQMIQDLDFTVRYGNSKIQLPRYYTDRLLPHSLEDLRKLIPEDPVNGDWTAYDQMSLLRSRLYEKYNKKVFNRAKEEDRLQRSTEDIQKAIRTRARRIGSALDTFKSITNRRKDL